MSSIKGDYYIYLVRIDDGGVQLYEIIHTKDLLTNTSTYYGTIICMFNVHTERVARLFVYLFNKNNQGYVTYLNGNPMNIADPRGYNADHICKKMQECIYEAHHVVRYMSGYVDFITLHETLKKC